MKKRFYLVRRGEKVKIPDDPPLSEKGITQAKRTREFFKSIPVSKIYTSPARRCIETTVCISKILGLNYEVNDLLKERVNWGDKLGQSFGNFIVMWKKASKDRNWQPFVGDSSISAGKRMEKMISSSLSSDDRHILLVTHGGIICDYLRNVISKELLEQLSNVSDLSYLDESVKVCSITTVEIDTSDSKPKLISFANIEHLGNDC